MTMRCRLFGHHWLTDNHGVWMNHDWSVFMRPHEQRCKYCPARRTV